MLACCWEKTENICIQQWEIKCQNRTDIGGIKPAAAQSETFTENVPEGGGSLENHSYAAVASVWLQLLPLA